MNNLFSLSAEQLAPNKAKYEDKEYFINIGVEVEIDGKIEFLKLPITVSVDHLVNYDYKGLTHTDPNTRNKAQAVKAISEQLVSMFRSMTIDNNGLTIDEVSNEFPLIQKLAMQLNKSIKTLPETDVVNNPYLTALVK